MSRVLTTRKKLCFAGLACLLSIVVLELGARVWLGVMAPPETGADFDSERHRLVQTMRGDLESQAQGEQLYLTDPHFFWKLRPNVQIDVRNNVYEMIGDPVRWTIRTNAEGFRASPTLPSEKRPDPLIVCLGDSCTFGFRVDQHETYPSQLQTFLRNHGLPGATVLNYGVPGYSSFQGSRLAEQVIPRLRPDFVVIAFGANDLEQSLWSDQERGAMSPAVPGSLARIRRHLSIARLYDQLFRTRRVAPRAGSQGMFQRVNPEEYKQNLASMIKVARKCGAEVLLQDLIFVAPVYAEQIEGLVKQERVGHLDGRLLLQQGLEQIQAGTGYQEQRAVIDRFWETKLARYNYVYYSERYYQQLLSIPQWQGYLRYLLVEPVHPSALGHQLISEQVGTWILGKRGQQDH